MFILQISSPFRILFHSYSLCRLAIRSVCSHYYYFIFRLCICILSLYCALQLQQILMRSRFVQLWFVPFPKTQFECDINNAKIPIRQSKLNLHLLQPCRIRSALILSLFWWWPIHRKCVSANLNESLENLAFLPIYLWSTKWILLRLQYGSNTIPLFLCITYVRV